MTPPEALSIESLGHFFFDLERDFGVDITAIFTGTVRQFGRAALRTTDIMHRLERVVRTPFALAGLTMFLDWKHDCLLLGAPGASSRNTIDSRDTTSTTPIKKRGGP